MVTDALGPQGLEVRAVGLRAPAVLALGGEAAAGGARGRPERFCRVEVGRRVLVRARGRRGDEESQAADA